MRVLRREDKSLLYLVSLRRAYSFRKISLPINRANPKPRHNPAASICRTSEPCSVAMRGLSMELMNGGRAQSRMNRPTIILALRVRGLWLSVRSESFGMVDRVSQLRSGR